MQPDTPPPGGYLVVGTAGHIDHGKTSLIRSLTGVDLDTLPEEQARHITIALGFTHFPLPGGRTAAFVDVPGHERLVRTMVAGASGIDAALLCVSAVEGVMPQTREHLAILELLGVAQAVVALTFADLVDDELLALAEEEVREVLAPTPLADAPVVPFSSVTGRGRDELVAALDRLPGRPRPEAGPFRLPVDRVFTRHGHGTVVTGTVASGVLREGEEVEILPHAITARARSIQVHGRAVGSTRAGLRSAVNLTVALDDVERGCEVATPGAVPPSRVVDVRYQHLPGAPILEDDAEVRFLVGTSEVVARARPLGVERVPPPDAEGAPWRGYLQVRLPHPVAVLPGDRFVLRRASPMETLGGGVVLDPWARPVRHRDRTRAAEELARLDQGHVAVRLVRAGLRGLPVAEARRRGCLPEAGATWGRVAGDRAWAAEAWARHREAVLGALDRFHAAHPLVPGALRKELVEGSLRLLADRDLEALLEALVAAGDLDRDAGRYRRAGFRVTLDPALEAARERVRVAAREAGLAMLPPFALATVAAHPMADSLLHRMVEQGELVRVGPHLGDRAAVDAVVAEVRRWIDAGGTFSPTEAKERLGLTRKHLIPLLEWLDAQRITRRVGDLRQAYLQKPVQ